MSSGVQTVFASAGFSVGTAALGHRCNCGRAVSLADSVAETCKTMRFSEPARGSVAPQLSDPLLGAVSDLASLCCPPLPSQSLGPFLSVSLTSNPPTGPTRGAVVAQGRQPAAYPAFHWPHQLTHRCHQPPLHERALRLARRFRCRSVHRDACPLQCTPASPSVSLSAPKAHYRTSLVGCRAFSWLWSGGS